MKRTFQCAAVFILGCGLAVGQAQYQVLYSFLGYPDAGNPIGNLVRDRAGNLFGTAPYSGALGYGTVFELSPNSNGTWTESLLHNFCSDNSGELCLDGAIPQAGLALDGQGNLYGTTEGGGLYGACGDGQRGCGTVFELSPPSEPGGVWTEAILYNFCASFVQPYCLDGNAPAGTLTLDGSGNIYGTTIYGGTGRGGGTVFELSKSSGVWTESVLYSFCSLGSGYFCPDGHGPEAGVTFDTFGNLYGTTYAGGTKGQIGSGAVYELSPGPAGWSETAVYAGSTDQYGGAPLGEVSLDPHGNLYSTSSLGGLGVGTVFEINPKGRTGRWFSFNGTDGEVPAAGVVVDVRTNVLYGTTTGGTYTQGNVFQIARSGQETVIYTFCQQTNCADGSTPYSGLITDGAGNLYGMTEKGGAYGFGVVFEITPDAAHRGK